MKKLLITIITLTLLATTACTQAPVPTTTPDTSSTIPSVATSSTASDTNIKTLTGTVTTTDTDYINISTSDGNGWTLDNEPQYSDLTTGTNVTITFDTMNTADIYDDELIKVEAN